MASKTSHSECFVQAPTTANSAGDRVDLNQPTTQPFSSLSSPLSVSSHPAPQSQGGPAGKDESKEGNSKVVGTPSKLDVPKMVSVMGSIASTAMVPSGRILIQGLFYLYHLSACETLFPSPLLFSCSSR